jgi:hypothetical protein
MGRSPAYALPYSVFAAVGSPHTDEHFIHPCSLNKRGRYNLPLHADEGYSVQLHDQSLADYRFPDGNYWRANPKA